MQRSRGAQAPRDRKENVMYPEFIAIYAGLAVVLVLLIFILILQICILRNGGGSGSAHRRPVRGGQNSVAFCRNCAARLNASDRVCPQCGTPR